MKFDVSIFCMLIYELQVRVHSWLWRNRHRVTSHLKQLRKARHIMNHEFLIQNLVKCYVLNLRCSAMCHKTWVCPARVHRCGHFYPGWFTLLVRPCGENRVHILLALHLPAVLCVSHTHTDTHTYSKRLSSTYKELNFSQWELWPYLERPADLFVLAVGLSNKWSLSRRKPRQIRCINLQHCWTTAQAKTLKHGAQAQHLRVTVCNPIQMCPDVYTMPFFPPPRVAWEAQMLHSWSVLGEKTEETPRENGQLRQKPCLFSLNSVAFTNSSIAPGYFRAFPTHSYFLTQRVSFPSCCFREKKTFASSIIQKWGGMLSDAVFSHVFNSFKMENTLFNIMWHSIHP